MERRTLLKSLGGVAVGGMATIGAGTALSSGPMRRGTVEAKSITAETSGGIVGVLLAQAGDLSIEDETFADAFDTWRSVTVDEPTHERLQSAYDAVYYNVHVEHVPIRGSREAAVGESLAYRCERATFNSLEIDQTATFQVGDSDVPRIESTATEN